MAFAKQLTVSPLSETMLKDILSHALLEGASDIDITPERGHSFTINGKYLRYDSRMPISRVRDFVTIMTHQKVGKVSHFQYFFQGHQFRCVFSGDNNLRFRISNPAYLISRLPEPSHTSYDPLEHSILDNHTTETKHFPFANFLYAKVKENAEQKPLMNELNTGNQQQSIIPNQEKQPKSISRDVYHETRMHDMMEYYEKVN